MKKANKLKEIDMTTHSPRRIRVKNAALWALQSLLAALFLFSGGTKLTVPIDVLLKQMPLPLPGLFLRFIGACEVLGAFGLILPGLLRIRRELTALAASGLIVIMIGATALTLAVGGGATALIPVTVGLLLLLIARSRWIYFNAPSEVATLRVETLKTSAA
jgi:uncharacterized membrane protein YphA (DoxX/SURF4 family)